MKTPYHKILVEEGHTILVEVLIEESALNEIVRYLEMRYLILQTVIHE